ncbi:hypothetical protein ACIBH1_26440 [Nonomuraea sp. NPDC050663]|uniref:hypothetical protein n=1 Tax=Nonomuraea sp. NPDC050663 TaxID=3364370 RepID=UPI0037A203FD
MAGESGLDVDEWDCGTWHEPTMGVELHTDDGCYSAVWGSSFDHYGLEVYREPMTAHLRMIGEQGGSAAVDVTDHPCWSGVVGRKLTRVEIAWGQDSPSCPRVPYAIRLGAREKAVWIAAGRPAAWPPSGDFTLGTDDVMVLFTPELAAEVGFPSL